jgi:hypothetical protein
MIIRAKHIDTNFAVFTYGDLKVGRVNFNQDGDMTGGTVNRRGARSPISITEDRMPKLFAVLSSINWKEIAIS